MFKNKIVRRLVFWTGGILILLMFFVGAFVLPDQLRPLPEPAPPFVSLLAPDSPPQIDTVAAGIASPEPVQETAAKWQWEEPDVSGLPPEFLSVWEQYRQEMLALFDEYLELPGRTMDMPLEDALKELNELAQNAQDIRRETRNTDSPSTQTLAMAQLMEQHDTIHREAKRGIYIAHEEWYGAATTYHASNPPGEGGSKNWHKRNWDPVFYYLRRDGLRGRFMIGLISIEMRLRSIERSAKGPEPGENPPRPRLQPNH